MKSACVGVLSITQLIVFLARISDLMQYLNDPMRPVKMKNC